MTPNTRDRELREALTFIDYLWTAEGKVDGRSIALGELFDDDDPILADFARFRAALNAVPPEPATASDGYGWHGNGDLCLGAECGFVDDDGDHPAADVHSEDWYDGYAAAERDIERESARFRVRADR